MASKGKKFLQRYRVFAGFVFAFLYIWFARPTWTTLAVGISVAVIGLAIRAWACGHIQKVRELDTSGPYAHTRNPLYLGTSFIVIGFGIVSAVWWIALLAVIFYLSIYFPVMNVEAEELESWLGEEYREYAQNVPLFVPRLSPWKKQARKFDFKLYLKHSEYNAAIGTMLIAILLATKMVYFD